MKITRNDILTIAKKTHNRVGEKTIDDIDYQGWMNFIECHKNLFMWYENTIGGKEVLNNLDKVPDWAKERVLYSLNKKHVYVTQEIMKNPTDLVIIYSEFDKRVTISLDKNLNKKAGKILFLMAKHLDALLLKNGKQVIDEKMIESLP
jgi:hypothetical protein